ncbi:unnamed protein product [Amoebophrya sp. A25]|nr:unnamed protein product [Amoebophrya sp. A25]|eukprot:GSA25T00002320001.1
MFSASRSNEGERQRSEMMSVSLCMPQSLVPELSKRQQDADICKAVGYYQQTTERARMGYTHYDITAEIVDGAPRMQCGEKVGLGVNVIVHSLWLRGFQNITNSREDFYWDQDDVAADRDGLIPRQPLPVKVGFSLVPVGAAHHAMHLAARAAGT